MEKAFSDPDNTAYEERGHFRLKMNQAATVAEATGNWAYTAVMQAARLLNCTCFNSLLYPKNTGCEPHHDSHTKGQKDIWRFIIHCLPGGGLQWWAGGKLLCSFDVVGCFFVSSSWAAGFSDSYFYFILLKVEALCVRAALQSSMGPKKTHLVRWRT